MSFTGKVVVVTGASSGIGAAIAILFAKEGADVVMVARNQNKLNNVTDEVKKVGKAPYVINADLAKDEEQNRVVRETIDKYGKLDVLVNNAGFSVLGCILESTVLKSYDDVMALNVRALISLTMLAAPHLVATKGNIINISSVTSKVIPIRPSGIAYAVSKAAVDHFTRGAALELAASGVRVNAINPGPVKTDFLENAGMKVSWDDFASITALNRTSDVDEIAELCLFMASEKARGITGATYVVDNGYMLKKSS